MAILPRILDHRETLGFVNWNRFVQPKLGRTYFDVPAEDSPQAQQFAVHAISLQKDVVVPFCLHEQRELIIMSLDDNGYMAVLVLIDGQFTRYELRHQLQMVVIPKNCPYAIYRTGTEDARYRFFFSSQVDDTVWEDDIKALLRNEHLNNRED